MFKNKSRKLRTLYQWMAPYYSTPKEEMDYGVITLNNVWSPKCSPTEDELIFAYKQDATARKKNKRNSLSNHIISAEKKEMQNIFSKMCEKGFLYRYQTNKGNVKYIFAEEDEMLGQKTSRVKAIIAIENIREALSRDEQKNVLHVLKIEQVINQWINESTKQPETAVKTLKIQKLEEEAAILQATVNMINNNLQGEVTKRVEASYSPEEQANKIELQKLTEWFKPFMEAGPHVPKNWDFLNSVERQEIMKYFKENLNKDIQKEPLSFFIHHAGKIKKEVEFLNNKEAKLEVDIKETLDAEMPEYLEQHNKTFGDYLDKRREIKLLQIELGKEKLNYVYSLLPELLEGIQNPAVREL